jgi:hypothetical protein
MFTSIGFGRYILFGGHIESEMSERMALG